MCMQCGCLNDPPGVSAANWANSRASSLEQRVADLERKLSMLQDQLYVMRQYPQRHVHDD